MIFWTSQSLQLVFSVMIFPKYTFSSRMTTSFCILPSSPCSKKNYVHPKCSCFQPYSKKKKTRTHCHVSRFHSKKTKNIQKQPPKKKKKQQNTHRIDSSACSSAFMKWLEVRGAKPPRLRGLVSLMVRFWYMAQSLITQKGSVNQPGLSFL